MSRRSTSVSLDPSMFTGFLGTCSELFRSLGVSLAISKLLTFIAILIIVCSSNDTVRDVLLAREEVFPKLLKLPHIFFVIIIVVLIICMIATGLGIYGYARLDRDYMTFYGIVLILMIFWYFTFCLILLTQSDREDDLLKSLYKNYSESGSTRTAIGAVQRKFQCCRSEYYQFNLSRFKGRKAAYVPAGCCPEKKITHFDSFWKTAPYCHYKSAYKRICPTNKTTLVSSMRDADMYHVVYKAGIACAAVTGLETLVLFVMIYRLNLYLREQGLLF